MKVFTELFLYCQKFSAKAFSNKYEQMCSFLRICTNLLKKSLIENFNFCAPSYTYYAGLLENLVRTII